MPSLKTALPLESSPTPSQVAKSLWLGWGPRVVGAATFVLFVLPMLGTIWNVYNRASTILAESIQKQLLGAARVLAQGVDAEVHQTFGHPKQESSAAYQTEIDRLERMKMALDPGLMIKFVYTCTVKGDEIRFVLDTTPSGDLDQDGRDDKAHIMEHYETPSGTLREVFRTGVARVDQTPYEDRWGTFLSGYAPILDAHQRLVGVAGVDIELKEFELQLSGVRSVAVLSAVAALALSLLAGIGVAAYHRRLQRSVSQLVKASDAALAAERAKSDFLAAMSHELRTPMNAVLGMTELLKDTRLTEQQQSFVATVQSSGEVLLDKITDILEFSQLDVGDFKVQRVPVDLKSITEALRAQFDAELEAKELRFEVEIDPSAQQPFLGDPTHLRQVLRQLLSNAIRFTNEGSITLKARTRKTAENEARLDLTLADTGIGMSTEQMEALFEPFSQADRSTTRRQGGSGIGLAICKRLCDGMRGELKVESELGEGSVFNVVLPIDAIVVSGGGKVLVWSQDSMTRLLVTRVIEKGGCHPQVVASLTEWLDALRDQSFQAVVVDATETRDLNMDLVLKAARGARRIVINREPGQGSSEGIDVALESPLKPAELRGALKCRPAAD
jgi:signal transduction histidine kinase